MAAVAVLWCLAGTVQAQALPTGGVSTGPSPDRSCVERVWRSFANGLWYYDEAGRRVSPQPDYRWLVVRFSAGSVEGLDTGGGLPERIADFNALFRDAVTDTVYDPTIDPDLCMYRLRDPAQSARLTFRMAAAEGGVRIRYIQPALLVDGSPYALLDEVEVRWKTLATPDRKKALLEAVGARPGKMPSAGRVERARVDPCRVPVWKAADLLAEDLLVVSARPLLAKIETPVKVSLSVGINGSTLGSPIPFALDISFSKHIHIDPSTIANLNLQPPGIASNLFEIQYDSPLSSLEINASPIHLTGRIVFFAPGDFSLPGVPVYYGGNDQGTTEVKNITTASIPIHVATLVPPGQGEYRLKAPPAEPPEIVEPADAGKSRTEGLALMGAGAAGLILCLLGYVRISRSRRDLRLVAELLPSGEHAGEELLHLLSSDPKSFGLPGLAELGGRLRGYLGEKLGLAPEALGGSLNTFWGSSEAALPPRARPVVGELLGLIETALARGRVDATTVERCFRLAAEALEILDGADTGAET